MASEAGVPVDLYIYDLTNGLASMLSPVIIDEQPLLIGEKIDDKEIGRQVEGVWHTAIVVYDREYFYGAGGITSCEPGGTQLGAPLKIERLGETFVPRQLFVDYIQGLHSTTYTGAEYRLLEHNCNHFSDEVAQFLCGARVPKHILEQPAQLPPPLRLALTALLDNMLPQGNSTQPGQLAWDGGVRPRGARADSPDFLTLNTQIEQARHCRQAAGALMYRLYCAVKQGAERLRQTNAVVQGRGADNDTTTWRQCGRALGVVGSRLEAGVNTSPCIDGCSARRAAARCVEVAGAAAMLVRAAQLLTRRIRTRSQPPTAAGAELDKKRSTLAEKLARKERRAEKKRQKHGGQPPPQDMADGVEVEVQQQPAASSTSAGSAGSAGPSSSATPDADERAEQEMRRRQADPPIVYKDIDGAAEYEKLAAALEKSELSPEERTSLDELQQYLVQGEGSWVLGDDFLAFIGRILTDDSLSAARLPTLRCLAACALRDDVSLILHQDRRHHALLSYAQRIDTLPVPEQEALAMFMCNLFENLSSSEWLLYISEWESASGQPLSNIRCTTKVCVHAALAEGELREYGTALMYNVATKEVKTVVFDEVCVELGMALLQLLAWAPGEEHAWRALRALARLAQHSADVPQLVAMHSADVPQLVAMVGPDPAAFRSVCVCVCVLARLAQHSADVPQLVAMVGPDPAAFRGTSARIDEQIDLIAARLK
ncbi:PPPDE putative peptidase domain-containing protein [Phthorimaea operculella]|nr:PPPDE putative peptidase domain-containing protein [Phthorimaea operculella]